MKNPSATLINGSHTYQVDALSVAIILNYDMTPQAIASAYRIDLDRVERRADALIKMFSAAGLPWSFEMFAQQVKDAERRARNARICREMSDAAEAGIPLNRNA